MNKASQQHQIVDHKDALHDIRNYLAGRFVGATRDEALLQEVIKCMYVCVVASRIGLGKGVNLKALFDLERRKHKELFPKDEGIKLGETELRWVVEKLNACGLFTSDKDIIGDVYEVFIGNEARGQEGQFFTPKNAVDFLVKCIDPKPGERIIDPACGAAGFLTSAIIHTRHFGEKKCAQIYGIEKDEYLHRLAMIHVFLMGGEHNHLCCGNSLSWKDKDGDNINLPAEGKFDVVLTNPPFGTKIISAAHDELKLFQLSQKYRVSDSGELIPTHAKWANIPPQVLFVEKCIRLVRPGGRIGMVVPESLISSAKYRHVVAYMLKHCSISMVAGMPEVLFKTSGSGGTHTKTCLLIMHKREKPSTHSHDGGILFAEAKWCGNDSRGKRIARDDLPLIETGYREWKRKGKNSITAEKSLHYIVPTAQLKDYSLAPRLYSPEVRRGLDGLAETHHLLSVKSFVDDGLIELSTGDEVGKMAYGQGDIPFIRTSDISGWEIKPDPKHVVDESVYNDLKDKQDVRENDILMVRDGTYLIGSCAMITKFDTRIIFQSHIYKIRVNPGTMLTPYLLLAILGSDPVLKQIQSLRVTQDIIDSLGVRILDIILPIPKDPAVRKRISDMVERSIDDRVEARELAKSARQLVVR